jgi:VanZ family protein
MAFAWMGFIFYLSSLPNIPYLGHGWYTGFRDVAGHFTVYAVLAVLWERALAWAGVRRAERWAFIIAVIYGLSDEFHQSFVPGRSSDLFDVATDAAGAAFGLWLAGRIRLGRAQAGMADHQTV